MNPRHVATDVPIRSGGEPPSEPGLLSAAQKRRVRIWLVFVLGVVALLGIQAIFPDWHLLPRIEGALPATIVLTIFLAALVCEFIDSSLGMGYGTTLTPVLILAGFEPLQIVPAVLFSECLTGLAAGVLHHHDGNVDLIRDRQARSTAVWLTLLSVVGGIGAVALAISISTRALSAIISVIVVSMGLIILATLRHRLAYRRGHIIAVGGIAAFNKALSGGGYGPLVTGGQVVSGVAAKHAVAITSLAESLTCLVGLTAYLVLGQRLDWSLAVPLAAGALCSVPMATLTVRRMPESVIRGSVGAVTCLLGLLMLIKLLS